MARPLEYHDHSESSSLLARGEHLLAQTTKFEVREFPMSNLPNLDRPPGASVRRPFGVRISYICNRYFLHPTVCKSTFVILVPFLAYSQDNQAILSRLIYVDDYVQKVETLRRDFAALETKLPQLDEVIDRLQTISADTRKEVSAMQTNAPYTL